MCNYSYPEETCKLQSTIWDIERLLNITTRSENGVDYVRAQHVLNLADKLQREHDNV